VTDKEVLHRKDLSAPSIATRVIKANRTATGQSLIVVLLAVAISIITTCVVVYTRPTHVMGGANGALLVDSGNHPVATGAVKERMSLDAIARNGKAHDYNQIESVMVDVVNPETHQAEVLGFRTIGFHWYNTTDIDFFLEGAMTLHISAGIKTLAPTLRNAFGVTPAEHRRKLLLGMAIVGSLIVVAVAVDVYILWAERNIS